MAKKSTGPRLEVKPLAELRSHPDGVRTHTPDAVFTLANSVKMFGLIQVPLWNKTTGNILDGDLLLQALRMLEWTECPVLVVEIPEEDEDTVHLARNNHAGEWMWEAVSKHLKELAVRGRAIALTGFHESDYGPLMAADWSPAAKGPLDGSDANQFGLL